MCILINGHEYTTSKTLLVVSPLCTPSSEPQAWQLLYINSVTRVSLFGSDNSFLPLPTKNAPLMVVAIPNPHGMDEMDFTLFAINRSMASAIRTSVDEMASPYRPRNISTAWSSPNTPRGFGGARPLLKVQYVGGYKISVAPSLQILEQRAPWKEYSVSENQVNRILSDMRTRYSTGSFAFIIAEGYAETAHNPLDVSEIDQSGFGIMYRDARQSGCFFPTSHEPSFDVNGLLRPDVNLDVVVVALGAIIRPLTLVTPSQHSKFSFDEFKTSSSTFLSAKGIDSHVILRGDDSQLSFPVSKWGAVSRLVRYLPRRGAGEDHENSFVEPEQVRVASIWNLHGQYANTDLYARKATNNDVAVVERMLKDLDSWLTYRNSLKENNGKKKNSPSVFGIPYPDSSRLLVQFDFSLALLARQLSDPGINDRVSDVPCKFSGERRQCGPVAYLNLDIPDMDLDEMAYNEKDTIARHVTRDGSKVADTAGTTYIRISATLGPFETLQMRKVKYSPS